MKKFTTLLFCVIPLLCFSQVNNIPQSQPSDEDQVEASGMIDFGSAKDALIGLSTRDLLDLGYITESNLASEPPAGYVIPAADRAECTDAYIPRDGTYTAVPRNDDGSLYIGDIGFDFSFCGVTYSDVYINTNGNLSFGASVAQFSPDGFPYPTPMIAPFWADVDTRNTACGDAAYKLFTNYMIVTWENVGWYNENCSPLNTFQVIISDGNAPIVGVGNNIQFRYGEMEWTTGTASGGGPFGGSAATVGFNSGDNVNFEQVGRFNVDSDDYDGPFGASDGVHWLDYKCFVFNSGTNVWDVTCQDITVALDGNCEVSIVPEDIGSADVSGCANIDLEIDMSTFDCLNVGANLVTLTGDDGTETNSCTSTVTVTADNCGVISINQVGPFCSGDPSVPLIGSPAGGTWGGAADAAGNFNPALAGVGTHTVIYTNPIACPTTTSIDIEVTDGPSVEITPDPASYCEDLGFVDLTTVVSGGGAPYIYDWQTPSGMASDPFITATEPGAYSLTVTDASNCSSETVVFVTMNPSPIPSILDPGEICIEETLIELMATPPDGIWSGVAGINGEIFPQNLGPGDHTVIYTYTDANGCIGEDVFDIIIIDSPTAIAFNLGPYCEGDPIELFGDTDATGGVITYIWSGPSGYSSNDQNPTDATEAGTYTLEVISDGCFSLPENTEVVLVPSPILIVDNGGPYCFGDFIELFANTGGGGSVIEYQWNGPGGYTSTEQNPVDATEDGTYTATVTIDGCASGIEITTVEVAATPIAIPDNGGPYCLGELIELFGSAGGGTVTYSWTGPGGYTSTNQNPTDATEEGTYTLTVNVDGCDSQPENTTVVLNEIQAPIITGDPAICVGSTTFLDAGVGYAGYDWSTGDGTQMISVTGEDTYTVTVTDAVGCTNEASFSVSEYPDPVPTILGSNTFCSGSSTALDAGLFDSYIWSNGEVTQNVTITEPGIYTVVVTDLNGCTGTDEMEVIESAELNPTIGGELNFCQDGFTVLDANSGFLTYLWTDGSTDPTLVVNVPGVYGVVVSDLSGCTGEVLVTIEQNDLPTVAITGDEAFCEGDNSLLDAGGPFTDYQWSEGSTGQTVSVTTTGTYSVVVTDVNGCTNETSINVTVDQLPEPEVTGPEEFCTGSSVSLDAGGPFTSYLWSDGSTTQTINADEGTTYSVVVTNAAGCTGETQFILTENPDLTPVITGTLDFCIGANSILDAGDYETYIWSDGTTGQTIEVDETGSYSVVVTDDNGCTGETSVSVLVNDLPAVNVGGDDTFCEGTTVTLDAGGPFTDYDWSEGSTGQMIDVTTTGTYSVIVTDANGCTNEAAINVLANSNPEPDIAGSTTFCAGSSAILDAGTYVDYNWSQGSTTQTIAVDEGNTYSVTVTDVNGCTGETATTVTESTSLNPIISGEMEFCSDGNTLLDAGAGFETYEWSDGSGGQTLDVNTEGDFTVIVTDASGCSGETTVTVVINQLPTLDITGNQPFCTGENISLDAGAGFETYEWSDLSLNQSIDVTEGGTYSVIVTDANGCTNEMSIDVEENDNPIPVITGVTSFCSGDQVELDAGTFETYEWSDGSTTQTIMVDAGGTYDVVVTNANGCTGVTQLTVTENQNLEPEITGALGFCAGESVTLTAPAGFDYSWSTGDVSQTITVTTPGDYAVQISDANGCSGTDMVSVEVNDLPEPQIAGSTSFCIGTSTTLDAGAGYESYIWSDGSLNQTLEISEAGTYTVVVMTASGCVGETDITVILSSSLSPVIAGDLEICQGESSILDAGTGFASYIWSNGATTQTIETTAVGMYAVTVSDISGCTGENVASLVINPNPSTTIIGIANFCEGETPTLDAGPGFDTYLWSDGSTTQTILATASNTYSVIVTSAGNCSAEASIDVVENPNPQVEIVGPNSFCTGNSAMLSVDAVYDTYLWTTGETTSTIELTAAASVGVIVTDANGCTSQALVDVIENASLTPVINGIAEFCEGDNTILDAGSGYETYEWTTGETTQTIAIAAGGDFGVIVSDADGCSGTTEISVNIVSNPVPMIAGSTTFCTGSSTTLDVGTYDTYIWSEGSTTSTISTSVAGEYFVTVTNAIGCTGETSVMIEESTSLNPVISGPTAFCEGENVTLDAGAGFATYTWSDGSAGQTITLAAGGTVGVVVTDLSGCTGQTTVTVVENSSLTPVIDGALNFCGDENSMLDAGAGYEFYEWSNGGTTQMIEVTETGVYEVLVTDANGCTGITNVSVDANPDPVAAIGGSTTFCIGSSTTLDAGAFDSYIWSDGSTTQTITTGVPGDYTVIVTTAAGCTGEASVTIEENTELSPVVLGALVFCEGDNTILDAGSDFDTYIWSDGSTGQTLEVTASGDYSVVVTDLSGCSGEAVVSVEMNEPVNIGSANPPSFFCQNELENVVLVDLITDEDADGIWTETSGTSSQGAAFDAAAGTFATENQLPGTYTFQYFVSGGSVCPDESIEISVVINDLPVAVAGTGVELDCVNPALSLNAAGSSVGSDFEISWNGPTVVIDGNENTLTPTIEDPGTYELVVTNMLTGCSSSDMVEVTESTEVPVALAGLDQQITCISSSTNLQPDGTYGSDYQITWEGPGITAANMNDLNPEVDEPGVYTMTVTYIPNGCVSAPDEVEVLSNTADPVIVTDVPLMALDCDILAIDLIGSSPNPNANFVWTDASGMVIGTTAVVTGVDQEGTYYLTVTDNLTGCDAVESVVIVNNVSYPSADAGSPQLLDCNVTVVTLDGSGSQAGAGIIYTWSGPGIVGSNTGATISAEMPGLYTITAENTSNGCTTDATVLVDQNIVNPTVSIGTPQELDCSILETTLDGTGSSSGANYTYQWEDADGNPLGTSALIEVSDPGSYALFIQNSNNGCIGNASIEVTQDENVPQAALIDIVTPDCFGESTGVINVQEIEGGTAPYVYSIDGSDYAGSSFYPALSAGIYELALEDANGCEWSTTVEINEPPAVTLDLGLDLDLVWGDSASISAGINIPANQVDTIIWTPADQLICGDDNCLEVGILPSYSFAVSATMIDVNGCQVRDDLIVYLEKERKVYIPNAFSPNGDDNNDIFMVYAHDPTVKSVNFMRVFNRWGEIVFDLSNLEPNKAADGWDGTFHDEPLNPAVFVYIVEVEFIDGHVEMYKGDVTLMK